MKDTEASAVIRTSTVRNVAGPTPDNAILASALLAVTHGAWTKTLGLPAAAGQTWEEAGGDSIMTLHLMLVLERTLGRPVSVDMVNGGMTADDIACALQSEIESREDKRPVLYLLPGVFGDEMGLADFRRAVATRIRCELVSLPDLETPAAVLQNTCESGRLVAEAIMRRAPAGDVILGGYSFGGSLAMEAAHHLTTSGRTVCRLIVLDTILRDTIDAPIGMASAVRVWWSTPPWERRVALFVGLAKYDRLRESLLRTVRWLAPRSEHVARHLLHRHFRVRAIRSWQPPTLTVPVLLVASEHSTADMLSRWSALCPRLDIVRVKGGHTEIFEPAALTALCDAVSAAVAPIRRTSGF